jgi:hypothetical protein
MRWAASGAAVIAATVDVLYLGYVSGQGGGDPQFLRVPFVASFIALMAILAALSAFESASRWRPLLLGVAAAGLLLLGYFAMFSIGLPLLVAGLLAVYGLVRTLAGAPSSGGSASLTAPPRGPGSFRPAVAAGMAAAGALAVVVVLLGGFTLSDLAIRCPPSGQMGGGGISMLGGSYSYSCDGGRLTISR